MINTPKKTNFLFRGIFFEFMFYIGRAGKMLFSKAKSIGKKIAGSKLPTFIFLPKIMLMPIANMRIDPMHDI